jgi:hypothetical protein
VHCCNDSCVCSLMSPFKTDIIFYHFPSPISTLNHCPVFGVHYSWIIAEVEPGKYVHVEAVSSSPYIIGRKLFSERFKSIYDAIQTSSTEYDWWNVAKEYKYFISRRDFQK